MKLGGKTYETQFTTSTRDKKKYFVHEMHKPAVNVTFKHMAVKKEIKKHGEIEVEYMYKEYTKLEGMDVMGALDLNSLTRSQKKGALRAINLIEEKRSGKLKGRIFLDG